MSDLQLKSDPTLGDFQDYVRKLEDERGFTDQSAIEKCLLLGEELATLGIPSIGKQDAGEPRAGLHGALSRLAQVLVRAAS